MLVTYTIYFPFILRSLVHRYHPRVDPYNEAGETRTSIDEEYNRLMDSDKSPYNFLYNVFLRNVG